MSICQEHQQKIVFYGQTFSEIKNKKFCEKCIIKMNKNLILIEDLEKQFNILKQQFLTSIELKRYQNLQVLTNVKENLKKQMKQISTIFEQTNTFIDKQVEIIKNLKYESIEMLQINDDFQTFSQLTCEETIIFNNIQTQLLGYIKLFDYTEFQDQCKQSINQINFDNQKFYDSIWKDFNIKYNMNKDTEVDSKWICDEHKDKIYYVDLNQPKTVPNRLACGKCVPQYFVKYQSLDTLKQLWENQKLLIKNSIEKNDKLINQQISRTREFIIFLKDQVIQQIDCCIDKLDQITNNQNWIQKNNNYLLKKDWYQLEKEEVIIIANIFGQEQPEKVLEKKIDDQRYQNISNTKSLIENSYEKILEMANDQKSKFKDFFRSDYDQKDDNKITQKDNNNERMKSNLNLQQQLGFTINQRLESSFDEAIVYSIAFNQSGDIMIVGYGNKIIKVFTFDKGGLKLIQQLNHHKDIVTCLQFINSTSTFVSGANDKTILIWTQDGELSWKCQQHLQGHSDSLSCLIVSKSGNFIISGSSDTTIIIWKQVYNIWNYWQTLWCHKKKIISLSLNNSENQLISCAFEETMIIIFTYNNGTQLWTKNHSIKTNQWGLSLHFINDMLFTFQPYNQKIFQLFTKQNGKKEFQKTKDILLNKNNSSTITFPQIFNLQSKLLHKNGSQIIIFRITEDFQFIIAGLIDFNSDHIIGSITPDFQYLVTWDNQSNHLQIRKLVEQT